MRGHPLVPVGGRRLGIRSSSSRVYFANYAFLRVRAAFFAAADLPAAPLVRAAFFAAAERDAAGRLRDALLACFESAPRDADL